MAIISKATISSIHNYGTEVKEYILKLEKNYYYESGSFLLLTLEVQDSYSKWPDSRNFSIASAYRPDGTVKLIIRKVGSYTSRIFDQLQVGSTCMVKYAFGDFLLPFYDNNNDICCIAGGTGIAPILSFCEQLKEKKQLDRLRVFFSFKNEEENIGLEVLRNTVLPDRLYLYSTQQLTENAQMKRIEAREILDSGVNVQQAHFYICGSEDFTAYFKHALEKAGAENIYTDEW